MATDLHTQDTNPWYMLPSPDPLSPAEWMPNIDFWSSGRRLPSLIINASAPWYGSNLVSILRFSSHILNLIFAFIVVVVLVIACASMSLPSIDFLCVLTLSAAFFSVSLSCPTQIMSLLRFLFQAWIVEFSRRIHVLCIGLLVNQSCISLSCLYRFLAFSPIVVSPSESFLRLSHQFFPATQ